MLSFGLLLIQFGLDASGEVTLYFPMFHSSPSTPASYAAIEISAKTHAAILKGLKQTLSRFKGVGIDRDTGKRITYHSPLNERVDADSLTVAIRKIDKGYSIQVVV